MGQMMMRIMDQSLLMIIDNEMIDYKYIDASQTKLN
jgi:hypothetical protein